MHVFQSVCSITAASESHTMYGNTHAVLGRRIRRHRLACSKSSARGWERRVSGPLCFSKLRMLRISLNVAGWNQSLYNAIGIIEQRFSTVSWPIWVTKRYADVEPRLQRTPSVSFLQEFYRASRIITLITLDHYMPDSFGCENSILVALTRHDCDCKLRLLKPMRRIKHLL